MDNEVEAIEKAAAMPSDRRCPKCSGSSFLTTTVGGSRVLIDFCSRCKGLWLDKGEFDAIVAHLSEKLDVMSSEEMKRAAYEEIKEIWSGPEPVISEIFDAWAALNALLAIRIYENPVLASMLITAGRLGRSVGA